MILGETAYLVHHGVKGMKWGVRKSRPSSGKKRRKGPIQININVGRKAKKTKSSKESIKGLTDQELLARVNRLNLEKRYRDLSAPQKSAGKEFVSNILKESGKEVAKKYVTKGMDKSVEALLKKAKASTT